MSQNIIRALLVSVLLICHLSADDVSAQGSSSKTAGESVQTASLGDTFPKPGINLAPDINDIREGDSTSAQTCNDRGVMYSEKGQYDLALSEFNKALERDPMLAEAYNNRGITYSRKGQYDLAISDFTKALEIKPDAKAYYNRGITYAIKGQFDLALSDLKRSLEIQSIAASAYDAMGNVHVELACSDWKQACKLGNCDHLKEATRVGLCSE